MSLKDLRAQAARLGVKIVAERDDYGWGYWLEDTGWPDENFCVDHAEISDKLARLADERSVGG